MKYELMSVDIKLYSFYRSPTGRIVNIIFERPHEEDTFAYSEDH